jgi:hypothetical protein
MKANEHESDALTTRLAPVSIKKLLKYIVADKVKAEDLER